MRKLKQIDMKTWEIIQGNLCAREGSGYFNENFATAPIFGRKAAARPKLKLHSTSTPAAAVAKRFFLVF